MYNEWPFPDLRCTTKVDINDIRVSWVSKQSFFVGTTLQISKYCKTLFFVSEKNNYVKLRQSNLKKNKCTAIALR